MSSAVPRGRAGWLFATLTAPDRTCKIARRIRCRADTQHGQTAPDTINSASDVLGGHLAPGQRRRLLFDEYRFFPRRQLLLRGQVPVRVGARALDLLQVLLERQGELVSKADLIRFAWPDTFVHESNLKVNIAALRRSLPQDQPGLPYIVTVPGRGYRFAAPVRFETASASSAAPSHGGGLERQLEGSHLLIGREDDLGEVTRRVCDRGFVTIVGPAGVGKTSLAVAAARELTERFNDGVCFVDLAAINDAQLVCAAIASALGSAAGVIDLLVGIVDAVRSKNMLLILDNCEHVLTTSALVAEHMHLAVPEIGIIATSREPFRSKTENVYRLAPLRCPSDEVGLDGRQAMAFPAVELFVTRAQEAAGYGLSDPDVSVIAEICRRLDGIPLAIELAAPRLKSCDPASLLRHLKGSFDLLNYGPRTAPLRHQALQATLDWSYRLLSEAEASLLRHLSVFAGLFTTEDVLGITSDIVASPGETAACLDNLASKSLVSQTLSGGKAAYRLLDTTKTYAAERLRAEGEHRRACESHAVYMLDLFERAEAEWTWVAREDWMTTYGRRANDLRNAIDWAFGADGDVETGLRLSAAAIPLWDELSSVAECRQRVRTALDAAELTAHPDLEVRMKLATAHARSLTFAERLDPEAEGACRESVRLAELKGDADYQLRAVWGLAVLQSFAGRHRDVLASLDRFDAICERTKDSAAASSGARFRIMTQFYRGDIVGAHASLKRLARTARQSCGAHAHIALPSRSLRGDPRLARLRRMGTRGYARSRQGCQSRRRRRRRNRASGDTVQRSCPGLHSRCDLERRYRHGRAASQPARRQSQPEKPRELGSAQPLLPRCDRASPRKRGCGRADARRRQRDPRQQIPDPRADLPRHARRSGAAARPDRACAREHCSGHHACGPTG
ncbi:ATP-binding protein [Bradyrhizobium betae]